MRPIPVAFHIGPLEIHTYGIGLAVTFAFAFWYFERRLRHHGYRTDWLTGVFVWVIVSAVVGARTLHVLANLGYYSSHPAQVLAIWQGGLSSFGGILFAVPVGLVLTRRRCPELPITRALDLVAPVLMAAWSMGRLLGPQLMVAGGGHPTTQWFGMYYAGQAGKRLPVPVFQALEDFAVFCVLILLERRLDRWPDGSRRVNYPAGAVLGTGMVLWGIERTLDEHLWLGEDGRVGSVLVQVAGVALVVGGGVLLAVTWRRWRDWLAAGAPDGRAEDTPEAEAATEGAGDEPATGWPDRIRRSASRPNPPLSGAPPGGR
jgi:phosphatidylglycerol---prolipoprotein diacylglyceryl transferase